MATYTFDCNEGGEGHEPEHIEVEAETDEQAVENIMEAMKAHGDMHHPEFADKTPQELEDMIRQGWKKED